MLTIINLICGMAAIFFSFHGKIVLASAFIALGGFADLLDGPIARKLRVSGEFGAYLDSLADIVTFGIATSFVMYNAILIKLGSVGMVLMFLPGIFAALRLARFNTGLKQHIKKDSFQGLPVPAAALTLLSYNFSFILNSQFYFTGAAEIAGVLVILVSALMVTKLRFYQFSDLFKAKRKFTKAIFIAFLISIFVIAVLTNGLILFFLFAAYILGCPLYTSIKKRTSFGEDLYD